MTWETWTLAACIVFSGLWSGLLAMLTLIIHPMLAAMDGRGFTGFLHAFLPVARRAWFNYACVSPATAAVAARIDLRSQPPSPIAVARSGRPPCVYGGPMATWDSWPSRSSSA